MQCGVIHKKSTQDGSLEIFHDHCIVIIDRYPSQADVILPLPQNTDFLEYFHVDDKNEEIFILISEARRRILGKNMKCSIIHVKRGSIGIQYGRQYQLPEFINLSVCPNYQLHTHIDSYGQSVKSHFIPWYA